MELPKVIGECGTMNIRFLLDYGSFRDIQRQRSVIQRMPLLTLNHGFEPWYLDELPSEMKKLAKKLLADHRKNIKAMGVSKEIAQYYIPMGYRVMNCLTGDLPALVYVAELRATRFVHPTLQKRAHQLAQILESRFCSFGLKIHVDSVVGRFDVRRGEQDIIRKDK